MKPLSTLLLIDIQQGFTDPYWGPRNNPDFEKNAEKLLRHWRQLGAPVIHIQHLSLEENSPLRPDRPGADFMDFARPLAGEKVFTKHVNSGFIGTELESYLRDNGMNDLVLIGLTSDHCVSTTTRMAANLGFQATLVSDATATYDRLTSEGETIPAEMVHKISLASLHHEFARVISTRQLLD